jgi:GT2 family glycosyltransferase
VDEGPSSVIAICALGWNHAEITRRWLDSVRRHSSGHDVQLYLMDNGSDDATSAVMQSFHPRYFRRNPTNDSIHKGWNELTAAACRDGASVVIISNNDLIMGPDWLGPLMRELGKPELRYFLPNGNFTNITTFERDAATRRPPPGTRPARAGWCMVFPAAAIPLFWPIPEELQLWYGDDYIHRKLSAAGYRCEAVDDCVVHHMLSVSFNERTDHAAIVARDKIIYERICAEEADKAKQWVVYADGEKDR